MCSLLQALFGFLSTPAAVLIEIVKLLSVGHIRLAWIAAFLANSQANDEHNNDSVFPVPVGDSSTPLCPWKSKIQRTHTDLEEKINYDTLLRLLTFCKHSRTFSMYRFWTS